MMSHLSKLFKNYSSTTKDKIGLIYLFLIIFNLLVWVLVFIIFEDYPLLIGTAVIAYSFGLRHAVDADHIAAIDNVTRKLMQNGEKPVGIGFYFSLGHSTVVVIASIVIALTATSLQDKFPELQTLGSTIGTIVSAGFLFLIAFLNLLILRNVYLTFTKVKMGTSYNEQSLDHLMNRRGLISRIFNPLYKLISRSWHMYPLGFLFGLGFDTATEIGLLGITAVEATKGLSIWAILIFPALFAAGMSLVDTTDGILMLAAYGWAYVKPLRKLYYNFTITFVSVLIALFVGGIEVLSIIDNKIGLKGWFVNVINHLSGDFTLIGYFIIGIFIISWLGSTIIYKLKKFDELETENTDALIERA